MEVDLPETKAVETLPEDSDTVVLHVLKDGTIKLDKYEVKVEELGNYLKRMEFEKGKLLYLQADKDVAYGVVVKVMAEVRPQASRSWEWLRNRKKRIPKDKAFTCSNRCVI